MKYMDSFDKFEEKELPNKICKKKHFRGGKKLLFVRTPVLLPLAGKRFAGSSFFKILPVRTVGPAGAHLA